MNSYLIKGYSIAPIYENNAHTTNHQFVRTYPKVYLQRYVFYLLQLIIVQSISNIPSKLVVL